MLKRALGAIASLCLLAGCVTTGDPTTTVDTWRGLYVNEMLPPLEMSALGNRADREGRVSIRYLPAGAVAAACAATGEGGVTQACVVRRGNTYVVYVDNGYPFWFQELLATHEFGHVGQYEAGIPRDHAGYADPTVDLIRRLGG